MKRKQSRSSAEMATFFDGMRKMLTSLPHEAEKEEILTSLDAILRFLTEARDRLAKLPDSETVSEVADAARTLESFLSKGDSDPLVRAILGRGSPKRPRNGAAGGKHTEGADLNVRELQELSTQELQSKLNDAEAFPVARLRAIADRLGIGGLRNVDRVTLIGHITTRMSNLRGYRNLREGNSSEPAGVGDR